MYCTENRGNRQINFFCILLYSPVFNLSAMGYASGAMFVERVFQRESKKQAQDMIDSIKAAFEQRLNHLKWMDDETRNAALKKARAITGKCIKEKPG